MDHETESQKLSMATGYQPYQSENATEKLPYDWEMDEVLQMAKAFRISSDEESEDSYTSDDFLVPEPPSISWILEGTSYTSSSKTTTSVEENYIEDDLSSLTISDIRVSNVPQKHEFAKERVEKEGNVYDKFYNACLKGQVSIVKDILETHNGTLAPDEYGQTSLYAACLGNHQNIIKLLISFGYDVNHQDNEGKTPLHRAFENQDLDLAKFLITELSASTEVRDAQNWTPLHTAVDRGYLDFSQDVNHKFLNQDVNSEVRWIQLHAACFEGRTHDVQVLLDANTDVNRVSSAGYTPLHIAVTKNNTDLVCLLIDQNADVNSMTSRRLAPLHVAAENCNDAIIQKLLAMKANPNLKDALGNTSLHLSVRLIQETKPKLLKVEFYADKSAIYRAYSVQTVQALIGCGVDVNAVNKRCQTALLLACNDGRDELVKILLDAGADPNITDKYGDLSLHSAVYGNCSTEVLQKIIDHGGHVNAANNEGESAILLAVCRAKKEIVNLLLISRADPNIADANGDACLHGAVTVECSEEILQDLIVHGADVNAVNQSGRTPLVLSCFYGQKDSVKVLLGAEADPAISDEDDFSCLHAAVDGRCSKDILQALIDHGAHINAKRKDGTTALLSACRTGQSTSVMFLLDSGADVKIGKPDGNTCLYLAVHGHCSKDTLQKIIDQGSDVNAFNRKGETALIRACYIAQTELVKILLKNGADPNISDASGYSSLLAAIYGNCTNETLKEIIACKADLDAQNKDGRTALMLACLFKQQEAVQIILEAGSNPNIADNHGYTSLFVAVLKGCRKNIIQALIDHGADVNATDKDNVTAIMYACRKRRLNLFHVLLKAGADTNTVDKDDNTCLWYAAHGNCSKKVLQAIIDHGGDVNATNKDGLTALMTACKERHIDTMHVLLKAGSDTNIADKNGITCLILAVAADCSNEVLQEIIVHGADVNATDNGGLTALMWACEKRHVDAIYVLLKAGADTNIADENGNTCLRHALCGDCSIEVFHAIIDHGVDVDATNKENHTAIITACEKRCEDVIHLLLKAGSNPIIANYYGETCLMYAADRDCSKEVLQAIIDHGADVNATNKENHTALITACAKKHEDAIHVLLKAGSDINIADKYGQTCLMYAADRNCSKEVLQAIIDHGADLNATNKDNRTALMRACEERHEDAIYILLKAGSDTNISNNSDETCLMYAADRECSKEVLQALIDHGADVNATNKENHIALITACAKKHEDAIHVLLKAGSDINIADKYGQTCLIYAADRNCSKEVLQAMIDHGADLNATNKDNRTALMRACEERHEDAIYILLKAGSDTNISNNSDETCLMYAADRECSKEVLQALIDHGANVNAKDKDNHTALIMACAKRHEDAIRVLLKAGSDTNIAEINGSTCLMGAVTVDCSKDALQAIIDHGADVNATHKDNQTALMACVHRHVDAIHVLLEAGSDTNVADNHGETCLMHAANSDCSKEVLQTIIDHGADVNATNSIKLTELMMACEEKHVDAIHLLLNAGADTNITDNYGQTCLMHATINDCSKEVLQAIIDHGADVNANKDNFTALICACENGYVDAIHVLLKAGADNNIADENGNTCLRHAVCGHCCKEVFQAIINHGADVNATNKEHCTALMWACVQKHVYAIQILLKAGCDTNIADKDGNTCLMIAVNKDCSNDVLQTIIDHGADVNATMKQNITPLMFACNKANIDAIELLLNAGAKPTIRFAGTL